MTLRTSRRSAVRPRLHWAWLVAAAAFVALLAAGAFRAAPGVLIDPLHAEFGWSRGTISLAVSVNLLLYGLIAPFAAALMERLGMRRVVAGALVLVAAGSGLTVLMTASWQLLLCWGVLVGAGTGSMALTFVATVTGRWFVTHRGLVSGILTAASAAGQLVFLPLVAGLATGHGWRWASLLIAAAALGVVPVVLLCLREQPRDVGTVAYGASGTEDMGDTAAPPAGGSAAHALRTLRGAMRTPAFWLLAGGFAICGASTNGLIGTHFVPAAHDHGMPATAAAGLLAVVGIFDVVGTVFSGWLTDRVDPRVLLAVYYVLRGLSLAILPQLFAPTTEPPMWAFIVFYGLDWVATVPPTVALCRERFGNAGPIVFGWVFASHQIGAALAAFGAGFVRDQLGSYDLAWYVAGGLCAVAAVMSANIRRTGVTHETLR
ncbi:MULTISPECIES: MFS transporter [Prauserella salsuginis group]|uniref:MFS transporter n=1 Tax=Prauserella salsuginis TaxID=387889 RepID=A0ABW6G6D8_9PSEU|nr:MULTISPECIES: MFS transporter [Prauserella salsuginis group]MCR3722855.1 Sugar phosphate permease [Prauserella flava]MCR3737090.1 Sugar phosphate permease [Prauserella salsuginis]